MRVLTKSDMLGVSGIVTWDRENPPTRSRR